MSTKYKYMYEFYILNKSWRGISSLFKNNLGNLYT